MIIYTNDGICQTELNADDPTKVQISVQKDAVELIKFTKQSTDTFSNDIKIRVLKADLTIKDYSLGGGITQPSADILLWSIDVAVDLENDNAQYDARITLNNNKRDMTGSILVNNSLF
jgi:hypothetical protein